MIRVLTWFLGPNLTEMFRENRLIRLSERQDTRELTGDALLEELRKKVSR